MTTAAYRNTIWVQSVILDTIMCKKNLESLGVPKSVETYVTSRVCSFVAERLVIPEEEEHELFLYCEYIADPTKGAHSERLHLLFKDFLDTNIEYISSIIKSCLLSLN